MNIQYGDWTVIQKIGSGSFGTVYEIERETLGFVQKAALKVISIPQSQSDEASIRSAGMDDARIGDYYRDLASEIVKELQTMEQLKGHTNIVSYEDHEIHRKLDGVGWEIFIRMELLTPLMKYITNHQMSREQVIQLGIDLCRALERCEALNIIHRDIKPDNIFLSRLGDGKLGDFGIARTVERTVSGMSKKGTYSFMAPEVYMGQPYGRTVDIYSLGLVLYRLLNYNRGPFLPIPPAPIRFRDQEESLVRRIKGEPLPPPAQADANLARIVLKACSFDASQRFSTALEMRMALERAIETEIPRQAHFSPEKLYDMGDDTICEEGSAPEPAIPSSSAAEHEAVAEIPPEPEEPQPDGRPEHRDEGTITEILTEPEGYQEYQNEGTGSAFGSGSQVEAKHEIASNNLGGQADFGPIDEGTVSVFSHNGNEPEHNRSSAELEDEGTVSVFSQKEGSGTDQSRHRGVTMCNIEFRSGSGIIYSQMQVPRGKMIVPPVMEDPSFTGWKPKVPAQARWDQVFVAQFNASGAAQSAGHRQNNLEKTCRLVFKDEKGYTIAQINVPRGQAIEQPRINNPNFIGWKPQVPAQARWDQVFVAQYASPANQKQHSRQNRADSRQGGNQGNSNWGGTPQPAGNVQIRTDRYTPPPLTSVLGTPSVSTQNVPYVVRLKTQERFPVAVGYFRIGRNYDAELRIDDNMAVGRKHAVIVSHNGACFLVDLHSTNHSYINHMWLAPDVEYRLYPGTEFVLGDEAFRFEV